VKTGWTYFAYSVPSLMEKTATWNCGFAPGNDHAVEAVKRMLEVVEEAWKDGATEEEVAQMRSGRLNGRPFLGDTTLKRLEVAMRTRLVGYDRLAATDQMANITAAQAHAAFAEAIDPARLTVVVVGTADVLLADLTECLGAPHQVISASELIPSS